jgi:hypothetical protein
LVVSTADRAKKIRALPIMQAEALQFDEDNRDYLGQTLGEMERKLNEMAPPDQEA